MVFNSWQIRYIKLHSFFINVTQHFDAFIETTHINTNKCCRFDLKYIQYFFIQAFWFMSVHSIFSFFGKCYKLEDSGRKGMQSNIHYLLKIWKINLGSDQVASYSKFGTSQMEWFTPFHKVLCSINFNSFFWSLLRHHLDGKLARPISKFTSSHFNILCIPSEKTDVVHKFLPSEIVQFGCHSMVHSLGQP